MSSKNGVSLIRIVIFVFALLFLPLAASAGDGTLNVLYTGSVKGELEPCGCSPKTTSGGLARLSGYISAERSELEPYVLVDAGHSTGEDTAQGRLKADALMMSFGIIGFDAVALKASDEFADGFLSGLVEDYRIPAVSDGASVRVERGPAHVNVSTDPDGHEEESINILLTDLPPAEAETINGWDVIVTSSGEILDEPVSADGTVIVSGYPKGKKLGILSLTLDGSGGVTGSEHRWKELGDEVEEDPDIRGVLDRYDANVAELLEKEEEKAARSGPYLGVESCERCHRPFVNTWRESRHSDAFASLEEVGKSQDPECIKCHYTGHGEEGGFYSLSTTPKLANVQCEVCHGPGKEHVADFTVSMKTADRSVCLKCHTPDNSPDFDYKKYLEKIKHW